MDEIVNEETWTDDLSEIECPHCHEVLDLSDSPGFYTEDQQNLDCHECGKPIELYGSSSWSWTVYKGDET